MGLKPRKALAASRLRRGRKEDLDLFGDLRVYRHSSEFPKEAFERIPPSHHKVIDGGNGRFFAGLAHGLPGLHEVLTGRCSTVRLLESFSPGLDEDESDVRTFRWGLQSAGGLVLIGIPVFVGEIRDRILADHLACLPPEFLSLYRDFDGIGIHDDYWSDACELPLAPSSWISVQEFCDDRNRRLEHPGFHDRLEVDAADLRVLVNGSGGLVLLNFDEKPSRLFHLPGNDCSAMAVIQDPGTCLDRYFATALLGQPGPLPIHNLTGCTQDQQALPPRKPTKTEDR